MEEMKITYIPPGKLKPYPKNAKKHPKEQVEHIANSIKAFGFRQPIVIDKDNVVVIGHGRLLAAKKLGLEKVPVTLADDLSEEQINALRLADNKTNESEWDLPLLDAELAELEMDFDMSEFGFDLEEAVKEGEEKENKYTSETKIPQYEPKEEQPSVEELIFTGKVEAMLEEIDNADISEEEKRFLKIAAYRHAVIDFDKVADYYAAANAEVQRLMERSALVLIDIDDAIANGFTALTQTLSDMMESEIDE